MLVRLWLLETTFTVFPYSYGVRTIKLLEDCIAVMRFDFYSHAVNASGYCDLASICMGKEYLRVFY